MYAPPVVQTGYCPDHPHIKLGKVPGKDRAYKCPLDGRVYDYSKGFQTDDGEKTTANSVRNQIPNGMGRKY